MYELIGVASGCGAPVPTTAKGPHALLKKDLEKRLHGREIMAHRGPMIYPLYEKNQETLFLLEDLCTRLAVATSMALHARRMPVIFGGDHSIAIGTWSGVTHALDAQQSFGLIWLDAHMDAHTPTTTPSGAYHGMPLAALLGYGDPELTGIITRSAKLAPQHPSSSWEYDLSRQEKRNF